MLRRFIFASESVGEGHPDKVCDTISDAVLDACIRQDRKSRVACETYAKSNVVIVGGEITIPNLPKASTSKTSFRSTRSCAIPCARLVTSTMTMFFTPKKIFVNTVITDQSHDISQGVDAKKAKGKSSSEQGAGDQGLMFGFACDDTPELMPAPIMFAHRLGRELTRIRKSGKAEWLRPDAKSQVSVIYENGKPVGISNVVVSTQHTDDIEHKGIEKFIIEKVIRKVLPKSMLNGTTRFLVNPTGRFVIGGPQGDTGLTGRKIIVDSYGGWGRHGGGAFSGKDPSKVDRSAAYMGRWVAKNVVAAGLATRCEIQFAYAIGYPDPVSMNINTFGTNTVSEEAIERAVNRTFSFKPAEIIQQLDLLRPIYTKTTNYGHFGKIDDPDITWEKTDKTAALKRAAK